MATIADILPIEFIQTLFTIIIINSLFLNMIMIYITASSPTMRTHANLYIQSLSVVDLILGSLISGSVLALILNGCLPYGLCLTSGYLELAMFATGVFSLLALTHHRYKATFKHQNDLIPLSRTVKKILIIWLAGFLYATRFFLQIEVEKLLLVHDAQDETNITLDREATHFCHFFLEVQKLNLPFRVFDFVVLFVIPVTLMIWMYFCIYKELNKKHFLATMMAKTARNKRITKMLVTAVTIFIVCWLPYYMQDIIIDTVQYATGSGETKIVPVTLRFVTVVLALSNSIANPIVYGLMNKNFRNEIYHRCRRLLTGFGHQNQVRPLTINTAATAATAVVATTTTNKQKKVSVILQTPTCKN